MTNRRPTARDSVVMVMPPASLFKTTQFDSPLTVLPTRLVVAARQGRFAFHSQDSPHFGAKNYKEKALKKFERRRQRVPIS